MCLLLCAYLNNVQQISVLKQWVIHSLICLKSTLRFCWQTCLWCILFNVFIASAAEIDSTAFTSNLRAMYLVAMELGSWGARIILHICQRILWWGLVQNKLNCSIFPSLQIPYFAEAGQSFIRELALTSVMYFFPKGEIIQYSKTITRELFCIRRGTCEVSIFHKVYFFTNIWSQLYALRF